MGSLETFTQREEFFDPQSTAISVYEKVNALFPDAITLEDAEVVVERYKGATITNFIGVFAHKELRSLAEKRINEPTLLEPQLPHQLTPPQ